MILKPYYIMESLKNMFRSALYVFMMTITMVQTSCAQRNIYNDDIKGNDVVLLQYSKFWTQVFLFHPEIIESNNNVLATWNNAYDKFYDQALEVESEIQLVPLLNQMLFEELNPNGSSVIHLDQIVSDTCHTGNFTLRNFRNSNRDFIYADLRNHKNYLSSKFFSTFDSLSKVTSEKSVIILDLRWQGIDRIDRNDVIKHYPFRFFIDSTTGKSFHYQREYIGWNERNYFGSYRQRVVQTDFEELLPMNQAESWVKRWSPEVNFEEIQPIKSKLVILANCNTLTISDAYINHLKQKSGAIILFDKNYYSSAAIPSGTVKLSEKIFLNLRPEKLNTIQILVDTLLSFKSGPNSSHILKAIDKLLVEKEFTIKDDHLSKELNFDLDLSRDIEDDTTIVNEPFFVKYWGKVWSIINYFHPHVSHSMWNKAMNDGFDSARQSKSYKEFLRHLLKAMTVLKDGHVSVSNQYQILPEKNFSIPLQLEKLDSSYLIIDSKVEPIQPGDQIIGINDLSIEAYEENLTKYQSFSTIQAKNSWLNFYNRSVRRDSGETVSLTIQNQRGKTYDTTLKAISVPWKTFTYSHKRSLFKVYPDFSALYVDLTQHNSISALDSLVQTELEMKNLILDMRGYTYRFGHSSNLLKRLSNQPLKSPMYIKPYVTGGSLENQNFFKDQNILETKNNDSIPVWSRNIIVLTSSKSQSSPENILMWLDQLDNITFIGEKTRGTNGNTAEIHLPGNFSIWFTGMDVRYSTGEKFQNIGFVPDIIVEKNINDLIEKKDSILEVALKNCVK